MSSVLCWLASILMMAGFNSAAANFAELYLLVTVLAAILAGIDPYGGFGRISGLLLALTLLQTLSSGFNLLRLDAYLSLAPWGCILLLVIALRQIAPRARSRQG
ncbi:ABC transporter permease [Jannaschia sp. CCS1]|uniref:ABC transporter permease n=1 Tax=Jannaschia sp. (strain CCS1) TaxID=290400 RepID=UPI000053B1B7|nr:ABC transporter permease [Jannaschia sp. CCS1]